MDVTKLKTKLTVMDWLFSFLQLGCLIGTIVTIILFINTSNPLYLPIVFMLFFGIFYVYIQRIKYLKRFIVKLRTQNVKMQVALIQNRIDILEKSKVYFWKQSRKITK